MRKFLAGLVLAIFCISSMPTTFAQAIEGVGEVVDSFPNDGFFLDQNETEGNDLKMELEDLDYKIVDPFMDKFEHGEGVVSAKIYSAPRELIYSLETDEYSELPEDFSYFEYYNEGRETTEFGYQYFIGNGKDIRVGEFGITSGVMSFGEVDQIPLSTEKEPTEIGVKYRETYPGIDVEFRDGTFSREKFITIKEEPQYLNIDEDLIFNDIIETPYGARLFIGDPVGGEEIGETGEYEIESQPFYIVLEDGTVLEHGNSIAYDSESNDSEFREANSISVKQKILYDSEFPNEFVVQQIVPGDYLRSKERVYPVVVDPRVHYCKEGLIHYLDDNKVTSGCNMVDFYSREPQGDQIDTTEMYMGRGSGGYRLPVFQFKNLDNFIPQGSTIDGAWLNTFYKKSGAGSYNVNSNIYFQARMIDKSGNNGLDYLLGNTSVTGQTIGVKRDVGKDYTWYIKDIAQEWADDPSENNGLLLAQNGSRFNWEDRLHVLYSSSESDKTKRPFMSVRYTEPVQPKPDIEITRIEQVTDELKLNQPFQVRVWVKRNGSVNSAYKVRVNLAENKNDAVGSSDVEYIYPTDSNPRILLFTITPSVFYLPMDYIRVEVDSDNVIDESDETNNVEIKRITAPSALADLEVTDSSLRQPIMAKSDYNKVYFDLKNDGQTDAGRFRVAYYISRNNSLTGATYLDDDYIGSLSIGDNFNLSEGFRIPSSFSPGNYYILADIDADDAVVESNENNNLVSIPVEVRPDDAEVSLFGINLTGYPNGLKSGDRVFAGLRVENKSEAVDANGMTYALFLREESTGNLYELSDLTPTTYDLPKDDIGYIPAYGTIPNLPAGGMYRIKAIIDSQNQYSEINELDNILESDLFEIQASSSSGSPAAVYHGSSQGVSNSSTYNNINTNNEGDTTTENVGGDPVNLRTGHFDLTHSDVLVEGVGQPFMLKRTYNSKANDIDGRFGAGWSYSYNVYYHQDPTTKDVRLFHGGNLANTFTTNDGGQTFVAPEGSQDSLMNVSGKLVYKTLNGMEFHFSEEIDNDMSVLDKIVDTNGNTTSLQYVSRKNIKLLDTITDPSGRQMKFTYGPETDDRLWDNIVKVETLFGGNGKLENTYEYDVTSDPDRVFLDKAIQKRKFDGGEELVERSFDYDAEGRMVSYTDPRGTVVRNVYDAEARVVEQYMKNPRVHTGNQEDLVYSYDYNHIEFYPNVIKCTNYKEWQTDTEYTGSIMCFNNEELKVLEQDHLGNKKYFEYNQYGLPSTVIDGNYNVTKFEYDAKRRLVKKTLPNTEYKTETLYDYEDTFNKVVKIEEVSTHLVTGDVISRDQKYTYDTNGNMTISENYRGRKTHYTYDAKGNVLTSKDPRGNVMSYVYDADGNYLLSESIDVTDIDGVVTTSTVSYSYDDYGNKISRTDAEGNRWRYEYDNLGNVRKQINPDNSTITYSYDLENNLIEKIDENGNRTSFEVDKNLDESKLSVTHHSSASNLVAVQNYTQLGQKTSSVDPNGNVMSYVYDAANRKTREVTPVDTINHKYDANGLLIESTNSLGQKTTYEYDARNQRTKTKVHNGAEVLVTESVYDGFGRLFKVIDPNGNTEVTYKYYQESDLLHQRIDSYGFIEYFNYDHNDNTIIFWDRSFHRTDTEYDEMNRPIKVTHPDGTISTTKYDKRGLVVEVVDRMNADGTLDDHKTLFEYDDRGRLVKTTYADGSVTRQKYDAKGNVIETIDQLGRKTKYEYDEFDRERKVTDNDNRVVEKKYDANGNLVELVNQKGFATKYEYDEANRLVKTILADGSENSTVYDSSSNVLESYDFNGNKTSFEYDLANRLVRETSAAGLDTVYAYDKNGNLLSETTGLKVTRYEYDNLNRLVKQYNPGQKGNKFKKIETYSYDRDGNVRSYKNSNNKRINYEYDSLDRLVKKTRPEGVITYSYDNWGNLLLVDDESGVMTFDYDEMNRNTLETKQFAGLGSTYMVTRDYNEDGTLKEMVDPFNNQIEYSYDNRGLMDEVDLNGSQVVRYDYGNTGSMSTATFANGVKTEFNYDVRERMSELDTRLFTSVSPILIHEYTYDADGNRTKLIENGVETTYGYDNQNQLMEVLSGDKKLTYTYEIDGDMREYRLVENRVVTKKRVFKTFAYSDELNIVSTKDINGSGGYDDSIGIFSYDPNGNVVKELRGPGYNNYDTQKNYVWDSESRLKEINQHAFGDTSNQEIIARYVYDDFGNRTKKETDPEVTYYFNNGLNVLNEISETGQMAKLMIAGASGSVAELNVDGRLRFVHGDVQGTTRMITDENGQVVAEYEYDAFGELIGVNENAVVGGAAGATEGTDYLYTNQENDEESGLMYYNARYYNPEVGRFMSRDTYLGEMGSTLSRNRYAYVMNNPYRYTDPTGNFVEHNNRQFGNIFSAYWGAVKYTKGITTEAIGNWVGSENMVNNAQYDIIDGYNKINESTLDYVREELRYNDLTYKERFTEDIDFIEEIGEAMIEEGLSPDVVKAPPIQNNYSESATKVKGSIIDDVEENHNRLVSPESIGFVMGFASPMGRAGKAKNVYGELSDTIEDSYKKNKDKIYDVIEYINKNNFENKPGYNPSSTFWNRENLLPKIDSDGNKIKYIEHDIDPLPNQNGVFRNADRIVTGSDNKVYYTDSHYKTFIEITGN